LVPEECFGDKQKSSYFLQVNDTGFSIKSPAHIKFAAFEFSLNQYDYDSFIN